VDSLFVFVVALAPLVAADSHPLPFWAAAFASPAVCWGLSRLLLGRLSWMFLIVGTIVAVWSSSVAIVWLLGARSLWGVC
jgi:hypothetical protein